MTKVTLCSVVVDITLKKASKTPRSYSDVTVKVIRNIKEDSVCFKIETDAAEGSSKVRGLTKDGK